MTTTTLTKKLNALFKSSHIQKEYHKTDRPLINTLLEAVNVNYQFTPKQIDTFLYMTTYYYPEQKFLESTNPDDQKIIEYIFTNYDIPPKYLEQLYPDENHKCQCLDYLFKRNYDFSYDYFSFLYNYHFFDIDYYTTNHANVTFIAYQSLVNQKYDVFNKCIELIEKGPFNYDSLTIPFNQQNSVPPKKFIQLLNAICLKCTDDELYKITEFNNLILEPINYHIFIFILKRFTNKDKFIQYVIDTDTEDDCFLTCIQNGYTPTIDDIHILLLKGPILKYTRKYKFLSSSDTFMLISKFDLQPNITTLNIICEKGYNRYVNILITNYNISPTKETLDKSMISLNINIIRQILNHKIIPDGDTVNMLKNYNKNNDIIDVVELLIMHGLEIKYEHVDTLLSLGSVLKDLSRFNIKCDDKLYFTCFAYYNFPYDFCDIDPLRLKMYELCRKKTKFNEIEQFLRTNDIKLNKYALHYIACTNPKVATQLIRYYELEPSIITLLKTSVVKSFVNIDNIIKKHNIQDNMMEEYTINF